MKNLITILVFFILTVTTVRATNPTVITTAAESITIGHLEFFTAASYDSESENIIFMTTSEMNIVQIFNSNGELEFQLPIMSDNVQINKNLFSAGTYKLGFILQGDTNVHFTTVTIK